MKRYLVFIGGDYYPGGGMKDFEGDFDNIEDARSFVKNNMGYAMWYQIYDVKVREIIEQS